MIHIVLGKPGAGKTTIGKMLQKRLGWKFVSMGELLRTVSSGDSSIKKIINQGDLVSTEICRNVLSSYLVDSVFSDIPIILDGFPRDSNQAKLISTNAIGSVILIDIDDDTASQRLSLRNRKDDIKNIIENRFNIYHSNISDIRNVFRESGIAIQIVNNAQEEEAYVSIANIIKRNNEYDRFRSFK